MRNKLFWLCLLLVTLKGVLWSGLVPLWHFPDEQAHFAQVSYLAEIGRYPSQDGGVPEDLSEEILISERLLGTERENGMNQFTYHPEFRIPYTDSTIGLYEEEISAIPKDVRTRYVRYEAANYPPFYYASLAIPYRIFYAADLFTRVFASRIFNLLYAIMFAVVLWKIAEFLFPRSPFFPAAFTLLVHFQPMFTFVSSGVSSDNAINVWYALFFLFGLRLLHERLGKQHILFGAMLILSGPLVKQQSLIVFPVILFLLTYAYIRNTKHPLKRLHQIILGGILMLGIVLIIFRQNLALRSFLAIPLEYHGKIFGDLNAYLRWTVEHTIREVFPWYWGVFNWLGVVLPRWTNRILVRLMGIALLGLFVYVIRRMKSGFFRRYDRAILFFAFVSIWYFAAITLWDFIFYSRYHYSFGIQGRYFFPMIIAHFALLTIGFRALLPEKWNRWWPLCFYGLLVGMIGLNVHALIVVLGSYYSFESLEVFSMQVSQYKPLFFKFPWVFGWMGLYLTVLIVVLGFLARNALLLFRQKAVSVFH